MTQALHRESRGAGPALVCLHGWGLNQRVFDALRDALQPTHEFIGVDLPGHGRSDWDPQRAGFAAQRDWLLESLPPRCVLLGWSLGGQFALDIARVAPERVRRLVLVATTPRFTAAPDWSAGMKAGVFADFEQRFERDWQQTVSDFLALQLRGSRAADESLRVLNDALTHYGHAQPQALAAGLAILASLDLRPQLRSMASPTLVVAGQHDRITPPAAGAWLAAQLPAAEFVEMPHAAHVPFLSHAPRFLDLLRDFVGTPA